MCVKVGDSVVGIKDYQEYQITGIYGKVVYINEENVLIEFNEDMGGHAASFYYLSNDRKKLNEHLMCNCLYLPYSRWSEFIEIKECYVVNII